MQNPGMAGVSEDEHTDRRAERQASMGFLPRAASGRGDEATRMQCLSKTMGWKKCPWKF